MELSLALAWSWLLTPAPMQMGDMQMQMEPMEMQMGNMRLSMGTLQPTVGVTNFCPQCGHKVETSDRFCTHCGNSLRN